MHAIEPPLARRLYAASAIIVWASCWVALLFAGILLQFTFRWPWFAIVASAVFIISQPVALVLAFLFRCPACRRRLFVQGWRTLHPARRVLLPGIASWIAVALDIVRSREFICMHCGQRCAVKV